MIKLVLLLPILLITYNCAFTQSKEKMIIGSWEQIVDKNNKRDNTQIEIDGNKSTLVEIETLINFNQDKKAYINQSAKNGTEKNCYTAKYSISGNTLTIGRRSYKLLKLSNDSLVIEAKSDWLTEAYRYFRTSNIVVEVK